MARELCRKHFFNKLCTGQELIVVDIHKHLSLHTKFSKFRWLTNSQSFCLSYICKTTQWTQFYQTEFLGVFISYLQAKNCYHHSRVVCLLLVSLLRLSEIYSSAIPEPKFFKRLEIDSSAWNTQNHDSTESIKKSPAEIDASQS